MSRVTKNSIKVWPYLDNISNNIITYSSEHLNKSNVVSIDLSSLKTITTSGAAILLTKLIKTLEDYTCRIIRPENKEIDNFLSKIDFYYFIQENLKIETENLFESFVIKKETEEQVFEKNGSNYIMFPIFKLNFDVEKERIGYENFTDWFADVLLKKEFDIIKDKRDKLGTVLFEIAKNSQDHTDNIAFFGLDLLLDNDTQGRLSFSFCDLGVGISRNVRDSLDGKDNGLRKDAAKHFSFSDSYQFAFGIGNTTSKNKKNKGIGMSMIKDACHYLKMELSIWDARSMLLIPEKITHTELRKNVYDTGNNVGFYYYGILNF
ncbi:hypothetical protein OF897_18395 [Chryseobacterium formosus]|uniref:STAS domain-containing protein n=1 Tax=Chryseobacterium formosus TaxID=1537363 RepID=A0ABT3XW35_9FLAO|nr:hypothetical protein [Chryseobacterium formosus]MCX8525888.1 hypothetical protein [Chryseobacterium formosus]